MWPGRLPARWNRHPSLCAVPGTGGSPVWVIQVDPLALAGIVMAAVMAILMLTGVCRLIHSRRMAARAEETVRALTAENEALRRRYEEGCDLAEIAAEAERLGLVPEEQVPHIDLSGS